MIDTLDLQFNLTPEEMAFYIIPYLDKMQGYYFLSPEKYKRKEKFSLLEEYHHLIYSIIELIVILLLDFVQK